MRQYVPALTGVRALAAMMVFFHHYNPFSKTGDWNILYYLLNETYLGVSMFFVLSGFLLTMRYADSIRAKQFSWREYLLNRFARIFPLLILLVMLEYLIFDRVGVMELILNLTLLKGYFPDFVFSMVAQSWTLTVEETFNVLFPIVTIYFKKVRPAVLVLLGYTMFMLVNFQNQSEFLNNYTIIGYVLEFGIGMLLGNHVLKNGENRMQYTLIGVLLMVSSFIIMGILSYNYALNYASQNWLGWCLKSVFFSIGVALLLTGLVKRKSILNSILGNKFFDVLGKSSYAFYLLHIGSVASVIHSYITNSVVFLLVLWICAIGVYYLFERPIRKIIISK